jgi:hypothetical protein
MTLSVSSKPLGSHACHITAPPAGMLPSTGEFPASVTSSSLLTTIQSLTHTILKNPLLCPIKAHSIELWQVQELSIHQAYLHNALGFMEDRLYSQNLHPIPWPPKPGLLV